MSQQWQERYAGALMNTFGPPKLVLVRGEGAHVWDADGKEYVDLLGGIAVNALGHAHPALVAAVTEQLTTLGHVSNFFTSAPQVELAERLLSLVAADGRVFFTNSGTEANEAAFKLTRRTGRTHLVAAEGSFHGRTMGSLALTGKPHMREAFEPLPGGVEHIPATVEALEATIDESVAALFVEPIQGEAGVVELPDGFMEAARELTARHGALLVVDEIQTGAGRTGQWFGFQHAGITPDAITVAKGIGGGFPIGGLVTFGRASSLYSKGQHGSTFGGNPLATAVANAVLDEIETTGLVENATVRGTQIRERVEAMDSPLVTGTRGRGLLLGVALSEPVAMPLAAEAMRAGLIVNAANDSTIRMAPPLNIGDAEVDEFADKFSLALDAVASRR